MSTIFETTRGRPISIEAVPAYCPICGYELAGAEFRQLRPDQLTARVYAHVRQNEPQRLGWLVKWHRGMPAAKIPALLVTAPLGVDHGSDPFSVIRLVSSTGHPRFEVETYDAHPPTGRSWPDWGWEFGPSIE